jgi:hypothetical protein
MALSPNVVVVAPGELITANHLNNVRSNLDRIDNRVTAAHTSGTWTPTITGMTIGTGGTAGVSASYAYAAGILVIDVAAVMGTSGAAVTGAIAFSLPPGFTPARINATMLTPLVVTLTPGAGLNIGVASVTSASTVTIYAATAAGGYLSRQAITATTPATWAAGDSFGVQGVIKGTFP